MKHNLSLFFLLIHSTLSFHGPLNYQDQQHWPNHCSLGTHQSPIDLPLPSSCIQSPNYISINQIQYTPLTNKHLEYAHEYTFQLDTSQNGYISISIHNQTFQYNLTNIHFHLNSEHSINGNLFSTEMHLVHTLAPSSQTSSYENEYNKYLVVAIIFEPSSNARNNSFFETVDFNTRSNIPLLKWNSFLTERNNFYYYHGSLTTPGCDEQVNWIVIDKIYTISQEQFDIFKMYISSIYPKGNNRNVHPLNGRNVFYIIRKKEGYGAIYIVAGIFGIVCLLYGVFWIYRKCRKDNVMTLNELDNINV